MFLEGLRRRLVDIKGREHIKGAEVVADALKEGNIPAIVELSNNPHPSLRESAFKGLWQLARRHPAWTSAIAVGSLATAIAVDKAITAYETHEKSKKFADEIFEEYVADPLAPRDCIGIDEDHPEPQLNHKRVHEVAEIAFEKGREEEFIRKLCTSAIRHPNEGVEFWMNLSPQSEIFKALLEPSTVSTRHTYNQWETNVPSFKARYDRMLNYMAQELDRLVPRKPQNGKPRQYIDDLNKKLQKY